MIDSEARFFWPEIFLAHATALICLESFLTSEFKE